MIITATFTDGNLAVTTAPTWDAAYSALRSNFDGLGEYDRVADRDLQRELLDGQGVYTTMVDTEVGQ